MNRHLSALALLCATAAPLAAAPATPEGAAGIDRALRTYLGQTPGVIAVQPEGDNYAVTLDPAPWIALAGPGMTAEVSPLHFRLTDNGDGTWAVAQNGPVSIRLAVPGTLTFDAAADAMAMDCTFDTALMACRTSATTVSGVRSRQTQTDPDGTVTEVAYEVASVSAETSARAAVAGSGVDADMRYVAKSIAETIRVTPGAADAEAMPLSADITVANYAATAEAKAVRTEALYALLAWFVAHPSEAAIGADTDGLKATLRAALPFWSSVSGRFEAREVGVSTPFGAGSAESFAFALDMSGAINDGRFRESATVRGLKLPTELMPAWVPPLLPLEATIDVAVAGFDLAAPAALLLDSIGPDFEPDEGFDAKLLAALLPEGKVKITLAPQGVQTPTYTLDYEGGFDAGPGLLPEGKVTVAATGIEATLEALNAAPEDVRSGAVPGVMMLRGMAKPAGVGRFVWDIEMTADGKVLVNGTDMSALATMQ
jgi:hypothetical protein